MKIGDAAYELNEVLTHAPTLTDYLSPRAVCPSLLEARAAAKRDLPGRRWAIVERRIVAVSENANG